MRDLTGDRNFAPGLSLFNSACKCKFTVALFVFCSLTNMYSRSNESMQAFVSATSGYTLHTFGLTHEFSCWINLNMQNSVSAVSQFTLLVSSAVTDNFKIDLKPLSVHENRNDYFSPYCSEDGMLQSFLNVLQTFILCLKIESRPDMSSFICVIVCSVVMWVYWNYILTFFNESSWASIFLFWNFELQCFEILNCSAYLSKTEM